MIKINIFLIVIITILISACALKEDNPLHHKDAPSVINTTDWSVTHTSGVLSIKWTPFNEADCDGYYLYRSLSQNGQYVQLVDIVNNFEIDEQLEFIDHDVLSGVFYYYKISGYKIYDELKLEGKISEPKSGKVN